MTSLNDYLSATQASARQVLGASPNLSKTPAVASALISNNAPATHAVPIGQLVQGLQAQAAVQAASAAGAPINFLTEDEKAAYQAVSGQTLPELSVSQAQQAAKVTPQKPKKKQSHHWYDGITHVFTHTIPHALTTTGQDVVQSKYSPVHYALQGAQEAANLTHEEFAGGMEQLKSAFEGHPSALIHAPDVETTHGKLHDFGFDSDLLKGRVYNNLDGLRNRYGDNMVNDAKNMLDDPEGWAHPADNPALAGQRSDLQQDPNFINVVKEVDAKHLSPGREMASLLGYDPVKDGGRYNKVSGTFDAISTWFLDPTIVGGKAASELRLSGRVLHDATDAEGLRNVALNNKGVRKYWEGFHSAALATGSEDAATKANAYARIRILYPEAEPLVDEVTGKASKVLPVAPSIATVTTDSGETLSRVESGSGFIRTPGTPLDTYDKFVDHMARTNALLRVKGGVMASRTVYMPGSVSRFGLRSIRAKLVDYRNPSKLIPLPGDSADGLAGLDDLSEAAKVGQAARKYAKSVRGRFEQTSRRMTNYLPKESSFKYMDPSATENVRRFAMTYMPRKYSDHVAAMYANASEGDRLKIVRGLQEQVAHSAGLPATAKGRDLMKEMVEDPEKRQYAINPAQSESVNSETGAVSQSALTTGQLDDTVYLPSFVKLQRAAAKLVVGEHSYGLSKVLNNDQVDKVMDLVRLGWLARPATAVRNSLEDVLNVAIRGELPGRQQARLALAARAVRTRLAKGEEDPNLRRTVLKITGLQSLRSAKAGLYDRLSGPYQETIDHLSDPEVNGQMQQLHLGQVASVSDVSGAAEAGEIARAGFAPKRLKFNVEKDGYGLVNTDTASGIQAWIQNINQHFFNPKEGEATLKALIEPDEEKAIAGLVDYMKNDESFEEFRNRGARWNQTKGGVKVNGDKGLQEQAAQELAVDKMLALRDLLSDNDGAMIEPLVLRLLHEPKPNPMEARQFLPMLDNNGAMSLINHVWKNEGKINAKTFSRLKPVKEGKVSAADMEPVEEYYKSIVTKMPSQDWIMANVPAESRPAHAVGAKWVPAADIKGDDTGGIFKAVMSAASSIYDKVVQKPIEKMSQDPLFLVMYSAAWEHLKPMAEQMKKQGYTDEVAETWAKSTAANQAIQQVLKRIDDPTLRSQLSVTTSGFLLFERAQRNFLDRWLKTFAEDPTRVRKAQIGIMGAAHSGGVWQDDQGQWQFTYPGVGIAIQALDNALAGVGMKGVVKTAVLPNLSTQVVYMNPGLNSNLLPNASPLATLPINVMKHFMPEYDTEWNNLQQAAGGQLSVGQSFVEGFMPSIVRQGMSALKPDEKSALFLSGYKNYLEQSAANGTLPGPNASPDEVTKFIDNGRTSVKNQLVWRFLFGLIAPGPSGAPGSGHDPLHEPKEFQADIAYQVAGMRDLKSEARTLVNQYGPQQAEQIWAKTHPNELAYLVGSTKLAGKNTEVSPTQQAADYMLGNKSLFDKYPSVMAYFIPNTPGKFNQNAWQAELEAGLRQRKTPEELYNDVRTIGAERIYFQAKTTRDQAVQRALAGGNSKLANQIKSDFSSNFGQPFLAANPLLQQKFNNFDNTVLRQEQIVGELSQMVQNHELPSNVPQAGLQRMLQAYVGHNQYQASLKGKRDNYSISLRQGEQTQYDQYMADLTKKVPELADLYNGVFATIDS